MPASGLVKKRATYEDLLRVPDRLVAEILDGELFATPRQALRHAYATSVLGVEIGGPFHRGRGGPGGWWILDEPELPTAAGPSSPRTSALRSFEPSRSTPSSWIYRRSGPRKRRTPSGAARALPVNLISRSLVRKSPRCYRWGSAFRAQRYLVWGRIEVLKYRRRTSKSSISRVCLGK